MKWWEILIAVIAAGLYVQYAAHSAARNVWTVMAGDLQEIKARLTELDIKLDDLQQIASEIDSNTPRRGSVNPIDADRRI